MINIKKIFAGIMAFCIVGGVMQSVDMTENSIVIAANEENEIEEETTKDSPEVQSDEESVTEEETTPEVQTDLTYKKYNNYVEITGCSKDATKVIIPAEIEELPVTSIGSSAFSGCSSLTNVTIPDSVTNIKSETFKGCSGLTVVTIPDGVTSINSEAFSDCSNLTI